MQPIYSCDSPHNITLQAFPFHIVMIVEEKARPYVVAAAKYTICVNKWVRPQLMQAPHLNLLLER